jgi:Domain of unknown function (DUF397)
MTSTEREVDAPQWRKARRSANNGACVEVAVSGQVLIRDSKDPNGPVLRYPARSWHMFIANAGLGRFDPGSV